MEENKKITKKQIVTMSIGVSILIVLAITATYAFFRFGNNNAFGTSKITGKTPSSDASSVVLENINDELTINLNTEDMLQTNGNTTYWASPEGKKTSETINQIGRAKAMVEGTYTCNYTMTIEDKATSETSLYNAFQVMSTKSNNQIVLTVNEETYDFNQNSLFPITYNGILEGITQSDYQYITASMYIKNELNIDQTPLSNKDIDIEFKVTELNCNSTNALPEITRFAIGDYAASGKVYTNNPTIYIEWNNDNIESYCINEKDSINNCTWINTTSNNGEEVDYTLTGNIGDEIILYAFIKDNLGNISKTSNTVTITAPIGNAANYIISLADQPNTNVITQTHDTGTSGTIQTGHNTDTDYRYIGNNICSYDNGNYISGELNGTCLTRYNYTRTKISDGSTWSPTYQPKCPQNNDTYTYECTATFEGIKINDNGPKNYVCLGNIKSDGSCIDENHLYRIIGVIPTQTTKSGVYENRVKLIKARSYVDDDAIDKKYLWTGTDEQGTYSDPKYTSYTGATSNPNNWEESTLNRKVLNQTYYNSLDEKYQNMIGDSVWYLGGNITDQRKLTMIYNFERSESVCSTNNSCEESVGTNPSYIIQKIGLIYGSDYGFATAGGTSTNRNSCISNNMFDWNKVRDCFINDWLHNGINDEWTLTTGASNARWVMSISNEYGYVKYSRPSEYLYDVHPVFSLTSETRILSGTGSINSPYTLG